MQNPIEFAEQKLGVMCWPKMAEIFEAVHSGERKILVRSCNGAGKTTALAALCNWYLKTYEDSIVLTTASSWMQVKRNLWGEIRRQARNAKLYNDSDGSPVKLAETAIKLSDKHYMLGISPDVPENAMGFHAPRMLIAVDEATGVSRDIMDALSGNLTGADAQIVMICNPIDMQSYPYEAEQSGQWRLITISALEHPNVVTGEELIKGAVTREWIADRLRSWSYEVEQESSAIFVEWLDKWYHNAPIVQARILGEWADTGSEGFIAMELILASVGQCFQPDDPHSEPGSRAGSIAHDGSTDLRTIRSLGVDISRGNGGDATVFALFDGNRQMPFETYHTGDLMHTARGIKSIYDKWIAEGYTKETIAIALDDTGLGGGVSDRLKEMDVPHFPVNFAAKARGFLRNRKELTNARAEMFFVLEEELRDKAIQLLDHQHLHQELAAIRLATNANSTAYKMEDKELTKRRLGRSPDFADATALARYALRLKKYEKRDKVL
jgi:phage terminase large subunit